MNLRRDLRWASGLASFLASTRKSQKTPSFQIAPTCESVWPGLNVRGYINLVDSVSESKKYSQGGASPFLLQAPETLRARKAIAKFRTLRFTERFHSHILNMNRGTLYTRSFRRIHSSAIRYRSTKNGSTDPKSFRDFRETQVEFVNICFRIKPDETSLLRNSISEIPISRTLSSSSLTMCFPLLRRML